MKYPSLNSSTSTTVGHDIKETVSSLYTLSLYMTIMVIIIDAIDCIYVVLVDEIC